jgi:peptidoglycan/xylan/chitin deacetylase (PgdA/CDA1 family)
MIETPAIAAELSDSKRDCEEALGRPCESFAYPYSDYDERAVAAAGAAGYRFAVTVPRRPVEPRPLEWPRVGLYRGETASRARLRAWSRRNGGSRLARAALGLRRLGR